MWGLGRTRSIPQLNTRSTSLLRRQETDQLTGDLVLASAVQHSEVHDLRELPLLLRRLARQTVHLLRRSSVRIEIGIVKEPLDQHGIVRQMGCESHLYLRVVRESQLGTVVRDESPARPGLAGYLLEVGIRA